MTFRSLSIMVCSLLGLMAATTTQAATLYTGDLIKTANRPDVYYYGADAKRYVFPNEKTYFTWYGGFNTVTLTDAQLAQVPIGGAVTYRPGLKLVKVTTDPKVYAVAKGGTLRWIKTEALATALYGSDWATKVHDLPDAYFATYKLGADIASTADFDPNAELLAASSIAVDRGLTAPGTIPGPSPTTTGMISVTPSSALARAGDVVTITATGTHPSGFTKMEVFFDGNLVKTCIAVMTCSGEAQIPLSGTQSSYELKAVATAVNSDILTKVFTLPITQGQNEHVKIIVMRPQIRQGQVGEVIIETDGTIGVIRTDIYMNGESIEACASGIRQCRWADDLTAAVGYSYDFYGKVTDNLGRMYFTEHKTITISTNDSPIVNVLPAKTAIYAGETLDVTVTASDDDGVTQIEILKDGNVLKTCQGPTPCTLTTGPWPTAGSITFSGRATDGLGLTATNGNVTVTVQ